MFVQVPMVSVEELPAKLKHPSLKYYSAPKKEEIQNKDLFDRIKRSFVKPGIRTLLRHYKKLETNQYVCARNDCEIFTTTEARRYVQQRTHFASMNLDITFEEWSAREFADGELPPGNIDPIDNPNALELFANAADYHFYGAADNAMAVLVTVPAHIFDQVPAAPVVSGVDVDIESVRFKVHEFTTWIAQMESSFALFAKFQSYFKHTEQGRLFHLIDGEETPFYAKFMMGRFNKFEKLFGGLLLLLEMHYYRERFFYLRPNKVFFFQQKVISVQYFLKDS